MHWGLIYNNITISYLSGDVSIGIKKLRISGEFEMAENGKID